MTGLLPLVFGAPAALLALLALPAIWWLLRLTPPRPTVVDFPPTALMRDLVVREETPASTPWWLLALRLALAALIVLALAAPVWRPDGDDDGRTGPLWLLIDDGWPAAPIWEETRAAAARALDRAAARGRSVVLLGTAEAEGRAFDPASTDDARRRLAAHRPRPYAEDRPALLAALAASAEKAPPGSVLWLGHGADLAAPEATAAFAADLVRLARGAPVRLSLPARPAVLAVDRLDNAADATTVRLTRLPDAAPTDGRLDAFDRKGRRIAEAPFRFEPGAERAEARFTGPLDLRNDFARIEVADHASAGAVRLADERWRRRVVGLVSGTGFDRDQPLLAPTHYLEAALAPFADLRRPRNPETAAAIEEMIGAGVSVLVTADVGTLAEPTTARLRAWIEGGGVLIRFAGPRLTGTRADDGLLPVALRRGERLLGGALAWATPRGLGPFAETGPFAGLPLPADVRVSRQILAEPGPEVAARTWASLDDGTPLVTAAPLGAGRVVLFHVGADTAWSNLPLSGTFVEMLRRTVALAGRASAATATAGGTDRAVVLPPWRLLDGFGRLGEPGPEARPLALASLADARASRLHPPGLWGDDEVLAALQTVRTDDRVAALAPRAAATGLATVTRGPSSETPLAPLLLAVALVLALLDTLIAAAPALRRGHRARVAALALAVLALAPTPPSRAADPAPIAAATRDAALAPRLAHLRTGDAALDDLVRRGLLGLGETLADRTSFEPADPVAVDPAVDELAVHPLIYWAISPDAPALAPTALARLDAYMKGGGTLLIDTRDADDASLLAGTGRATPAGAALRRVLAGLDLPPLEPVPADHVLGHTFYLLRSFPGRFDSGPLWIEATAGGGDTADPDRADRPVRAGDGVSPILVTGNDFVGAWARADGGGDLLPMISTDPRGRETALRVGVNLVMYVLTGNYKADQVHVPALLERLKR